MVEGGPSLEVTTLSNAGSRLYMSPERLDGIDDPRADVYSLGAVLFELLTGRSFGKTSGHPDRHYQRLQLALAYLRAEFGINGDGVAALVGEMLSYDPAARPWPRDVERRAADLGATIGGPRLRDWAERHVPVLLSERIPDPFHKLVLDEQTEDEAARCSPLDLGRSPSEADLPDLPASAVDVVGNPVEAGDGLTRPAFEASGRDDSTTIHFVGPNDDVIVDTATGAPPRVDHVLLESTSTPAPQAARGARPIPTKAPSAAPPPPRSAGLLVALGTAALAVLLALVALGTWLASAPPDESSLDASSVSIAETAPPDPPTPAPVPEEPVAVLVTPPPRPTTVGATPAPTPAVAPEPVAPTPIAPTRPRVFAVAVSGDVTDVVLTGNASLGTAYSARLAGQSAGDGAGAAVTDAGDLDGTGAPWIAVGAPGRDGVAADAGVVYLVPGGTSGASSLAAAPTVLRGGVVGEAAGTSIAGLPDTDGDDRDELIVGAPGAGGGAVYLVRGPLSGVVDLADAYAILEGEVAGDAAGAVVIAADVTGDGLLDVVIGAPGAAAGLGAVYVWPSPVAAGTLTLGGAPYRVIGGGGSLGGAIANAGDLDGDGRDDLIVGDADDDTAYVVFGALFTR